MTPSEFFVGLDGLPTLRDRLPTRVIGGMLFSLVIVLILLAWTISLSRGLEKSDVATKEIDSLRIMANQIAIELIRPDPGQHVALGQAIDVQDQALAMLANSGPPNTAKLLSAPYILNQLKVVTQVWNQRVKPAVDEAENTGNASAYLDALREFLTETDRLNGMIELNDNKKRTLLRFFQLSIAVIGSVGTGLIIYLLYVWIIQPMFRLREGLQRLSAGHFNTRLPVKTRDEFGVLAHGFNLMADTLERLYLELENGVRTKTAELEKQNREIACLYAITAFLNLANDSESICRGFLCRVIREFEAVGGTVCVMASPSDHAHLVITEGIVPEAKELMLQATISPVVSDAATFRVVVNDETMGKFTVYFPSARQLSPSQVQLLSTLGQHLGIALDNRRLEAKARKLAVTHERSLMAQGLHDSIAQGLNFLKMQLQLLEDALSRADADDVRQIVPLLRTGVDESYQDVRELLVNFRTKLDQVEFTDAIEDAIGRFRRQTHISVSVEMQYKSGPPLAPEQQLQILFILQEALSNIRKHAEADHVHVSLYNHQDFKMEVIDNGTGYCATEMASQDENHIGLHIMHERAARLHAVLQMTSQPGVGTTVRLILPHAERSVV